MDQYCEIRSLGKVIFKNADDAGYGSGVANWNELAPDQKYEWLSNYYMKAMTFVPPEVRVDDPAAMDAAYGQIVSYPQEPQQPIM